MTPKKKIIVDYKNVPDDVLQLLAEKYPHGYKKAIIKFKNLKGEMVSAVPIETDDTSYLVKVSIQLQTMVDNFDLEEDDDLGADASDTIGRFDDEIDKESYDDDMDEAEDIADVESDLGDEDDEEDE
ncbi:MAG: hypothetical protein M9887_01840 [Chitinophagales bacterium]|nr:hypothetical protein [Chitinophagales bacterium]